jgi:exopolyphosphatase/pppGpp-phosphohydrolase
MQDQLKSGRQGSEGDPDFDITLESEDAEKADGGSSNGSEQGQGDAEEKMREELAKAAEQLAEDLAKKFEEEMAPVVEVGPAHLCPLVHKATARSSHGHVHHMAQSTALYGYHQQSRAVLCCAEY